MGYRHRARFGGVWTNSAENWEIGAGLEIGSSSGTSANASWNDNGMFESTDVYLDYAYAKHKWDMLSLTLGQHKNPYESSFILWDSDLRPTGATLQLKTDTALFATVGAYNVRSDSRVAATEEQSVASMYAGQIGAKLENEEVSALVALGYYHYDAEVSEYQFGLSNDDYQYQIGDIYGSIGTKIGDVKLSGYGQYAVNFGGDDDQTQLASTAFTGAVNTPAGYDSEDNDQAWVVGIDAGIGKFGFGYAYARIEGDSVPAFFADSDFGDGLPDDAVNAQGHILKASYKITDHLKFGFEADFTELIEDDNVTDDLEVALYQFDLQYKF